MWCTSTPPADPNPEQQATKPALSTPEEPEATAPEATQANAPAADPTTPTAPAADPPAEGSVKNPTTNVINVVNNWVGKAAKELKIRLSNVNIKVSNREYGAAMDISGGGKTKLSWMARIVWIIRRLRPMQDCASREGTLTITDETDDNGNKDHRPKSGDSGSLTAKGATSNGSAGIGGEKQAKAQKHHHRGLCKPLTQQAAVRVQVSAAAAEPPVMFPEMQKTSSSGAFQGDGNRRRWCCHWRRQC